MSNMLDILKKFDAVEQKAKINECGDMPSAAPSTPVTVNLTAPSAQDMAQILRALANIESGEAKPAMAAMPMAMAADAMEAEYEEVDVSEAMDPTAVMGQIRKMAKSVEQSPDERAHRIFAQEVEPSLIELFQHFDQQMDTKKKEAVRGLIRQNKAAQQQTDTRNANNIVEVLYGLMRGTDEAYINEPDEQYADHKFMTKDLSGGINREKNMYKPAAKGDNPMAVESIKARLYKALEEAKITKKDYDGDGKVEKSSDEWKGSRDKAIKKAMGKKTNEGITNWRGDDVDPQIGDMVELYASYDDGTPIRGKIVGPGKRGPKTFAIKFKNMLGKVVVDTFSAVDEFEVIKKATNEAKKAKPDFLDMDKDGNKKEPMKKAIKDKKKHPFKK